MTTRKLLMVAGALATIGLAGAAGTAAVSAETEGDTLPDKIARKFSLDRSEVQQVFDEHRDEKYTEHQAKLEERLDEAVAEGKLTDDQKSKILAKMKELTNAREGKREAFKDMTKEERRDAMKQHREDLKTWAEANDIPEEYLPFRFHVRHHGPGAMMHKNFDAGQTEKET